MQKRNWTPSLFSPPPGPQVIRDSKVTTIPTADLVKDDLVVLSAGNQIAADAKVVSGSVQVNESLITGESDEISKGVGSELLSGALSSLENATPFLLTWGQIPTPPGDQ